MCFKPRAHPFEVDLQKNLLTMCNYYKVLVMFMILVQILWISCVYADFENSWTMFNEQPCCAGSQNHHVRHHRGTRIFNLSNK